MKKSVLLALLLFLFPLVLFCESFEMGFLNHDNQNIVIREETVKINAEFGIRNKMEGLINESN